MESFGVAEEPHCKRSVNLSLREKNEGLREDGLWVGLNSVLKWRYRMDWGFSGKNCGWPGAYGRHSVSRGGITVGQ